MAVDIYLEDSHGKREAAILDSHSLLDELWPVGDAAFPLLQYVDPYGDAVFNGAQMVEVIRELEALSTKATSEDQKRVLAEIIGLADRCRKEPHCFLRFFGD